MVMSFEEPLLIVETAPVLSHRTSMDLRDSTGPQTTQLSQLEEVPWP